MLYFNVISTLICRILKCGGAVICEGIVTGVTHVLYSKKNSSVPVANKYKNCHCFEVTFIGDYLLSCGVRRFINLSNYQFTCCMLV